VISSAPLRCTSFTPRHRRQQPPGELCAVLLFLPVQTACVLVHCSPRAAFSGEAPASRRRAPPPLVCPPPSLRMHTSRAARSIADGPDLKGGVPLRSVHRGPVDQVHGRRSTAHVMLASCLRQRQPTAVRHVALHQPFAGCPCSFCKKAPVLLLFRTMPFHLIKLLQLGPVFFVKAPDLSGNPTRDPRINHLCYRP
jgi:hypothetical protein